MAVSSVPVHSGAISTTRAALRLAISRALREPFVQDIPAGSLTATGGTTTTAVVGSTYQLLWDGSGQWPGSWLYMTSGDNAGLERRIVTFVSSTGTFTVAEPFSNAVGAGDTFEIHTRASATSKHEAINRAIRASWPHFFQFKVADAVICLNPNGSVTETIIAYGSGLPNDIRQVVGMEIEPLRLNPITFTATSGTTGTIVKTLAGWTDDVYIGHSAAIVGGAGKGQQVDISDNSSDTLTLDTPLDTAPASGSVVYIKPPSEYNEWVPLDVMEWRPYGAPYLQYLRIPQRWQGSTGRVIRISYQTDLPALASDASTTPIPQEYLIHHACTILLLDIGLEGPTKDTEIEQRLAGWNAEERDGEREMQGFRPAVSPPSTGDEEKRKES